MSGHLAGQLAGRECLHDLRLHGGVLTVDNAVVVVVVVIIIAGGIVVIVGLRMLSGQVFPQRGLPGKFGLASGARNLRGRGRRR